MNWQGDEKIFARTPAAALVITAAGKNLSHGKSGITNSYAAALLLLMLEAAHADLLFTISLKRSTQNLDLSTTTQADHPIFQGVKQTFSIAVHAAPARLRLADRMGSRCKS
jgi:hypothetical protein